MKKTRFLPLTLLVALWPFLMLAGTDATNQLLPVFTAALNQVAALVEPATNEPPRTFTTTLKILQADGLPKELLGSQLELALQTPDHVRVAGAWEGQQGVICRDGQEIWINAVTKKFGLLGLPGIPPFASGPDGKEASPLGPLKLPLSPQQLLLLPLLTDLEPQPADNIGGIPCRVFNVKAKPEAVAALKLPRGTLKLWVRDTDSFPLEFAYHEGAITLQVELQQPQSSAPWPEEKWKLSPSSDEHIQSVARSHLTRFLQVSLSMLGEKVPPLGPATGQRSVLAREGEGRLEMMDGTRVLFLKGTPEEMGRQHGKLMRPQIRDLVNHILYGVGVGSSFEKGRWFVGEIESAEKRLEPFIDQRYFREMDAMADGCGLSREEVRLANFFPELFHCSGFALFGNATEDGHLYHGRILDYLRGLGLEQNAVVMVFQPEHGNAWVNVGYAGFIGSVTAMNEKHIAIGEMGGRGQGNWDGKPMAELVREVMEKADTLDQAIEIMRKGPRTCQYYYVVSDAKSRRAVGIAATPETFEIIMPGQSHPLLPHGIPDTILMSAGDRYEELARRVQAGYGKFNAERARALMQRPVCMTSNIHCALFAPDTLDFWVANADSEHPAAHARFTHYNLTELLQPAGAP
ncbi:MAG: C45 family autoproteolytic acyltransferase/hydolase [Limisphaerales bacterium]